MLVSNIVKSGEIIIPKIKPSIEKKEYIDEYILPIPKPYIKKKIISSNQNKKIIKKIKYILPKKKPLTFKVVKQKIADKSKYFSQRDFEIAKKAIFFMEKRNWNKELY